MPVPSRVRWPAAVIDLGHRVELRQVLVRVVHVVDDAEVGLQDGAAVLVPRREAELVRERRPAGGHVLPQRHVNGVEHVVVEVELVRADARLLERIDAERRHQRLASVLLPDEGIHVGGIRGIVQDDERRVHVTGRGRVWGSGDDESGRGERGQDSAHSLLHVVLLVRVWVVVELSGEQGAFRRQEHRAEASRLLQPARGLAPLACAGMNDRRRGGTAGRPPCLRRARAR